MRVKKERTRHEVQKALLFESCVKTALSSMVFRVGKTADGPGLELTFSTFPTLHDEGLRLTKSRLKLGKSADAMDFDRIFGYVDNWNLGEAPRLVTDFECAEAKYHIVTQDELWTQAKVKEIEDAYRDSLKTLTSTPTPWELLSDRLIPGSF